MGRWANRPSARVAWVTAAIGVLILVSVVGTVRVPSTFVELDVRASKVSFASSGALRLTSHLPLAFLGVLDPLEWGVVPASQTSERTVLADGVVSLETTADSASGIYLQGIFVDGDSTRVEIERARDNVYRLAIEGVAEDVSVSLDGPLGCSVSSSSCVYARAATARLRPRSGHLAIEIELIEPLTLAARVPAMDVDFSRIDGASPGAVGVPRRISAIQSGRVYFESLGRDPLELRAFQRLDPSGSNGLIRSLNLDSAGIQMNFVGEVTSLTTGVGNIERELLPTWLEWLRARSMLVFLWGTVLALLTLAQAAKRLWS